MKNERSKEISRERFLKKLIAHCLKIRRLNPNEILVFNIIASHGSYQVVIGPEYSTNDQKRYKLKPHTRRIEINGTMHHLFANQKGLSPLPEHDDIKSNLRGSTIMKDVLIHINHSPKDGFRIEIKNYESKNIKVKRIIKMDSENNLSPLDKLKSTGKLLEDAYKIIEEDILKALK